MSRKEWKNDRYTFVCGVDHVTSVFLQVWLADGDEPEILIDNMGVRRKKTASSISNAISYLILETEQRFRLAKRQGNPHPNLDAETVCRFARALDFHIDSEIYELLD